MSNAIRAQTQASTAAQPKRDNSVGDQSASPKTSDASTTATSARAQGQPERQSGATDRAAASAPSAWQQTLKTGWQSVSERVRTVSPTQLAIGAAAIGAAVWLGTRKRSSAPSASKGQQSSADRWGQPDQSRFGQASNETWQRPTDERWDD